MPIKSKMDWNRHFWGLRVEIAEFGGMEWGYLAKWTNAGRNFKLPDARWL
jgi:hypothetical protein